ncbi:hypothetical protein FHS83_002846 [Rhizomicrobium palustre]|uniref:Autotransporter domain-containing protein n=1 Tax=Rhizomicrobium palustre TaxID=189966 RepID=A0A846N0U0_9PROT|nr:autotransporter outer membrane beta-barrel domain-containing protein [Rhizomicrobium palustre]NIK89528.1 hypothetical protein [Rhizomicrobium palustre]
MSNCNRELDKKGWGHLSVWPGKSLLTGSTALSLIAAFGVSAGCALADVKVSSGTMVDSSTVTAGSGAIVLSGGTLNFSSTSSVSNAVSAATGSSSSITAGGNSGTLAGALTGTGAITLYSGTLILKNTADQAGYTGTMTVASGATLQMGDNSTSMIGGIISDGTTLINNGSVVFKSIATTGTTAAALLPNTYWGAMSGSGAVRVSGSNSQVYLTGTNTYTGTTTIDAGNTLFIGNANNYGSITSGSIAVAGTLAFNRSDLYVYNGTITGAGIVSQSGGGTLILNGNSVLTGASSMSYNNNLTPPAKVGYIGALRATSGWLQIGDAGHKTASITVPLANILKGAGMSGFGTLNGDLINGDDTQGTVSTPTTPTTQLMGGILMPGDGSTPGTFTLNGNYTQGTYGGLLIATTPTVTSKLVVSGTANIKGQLSISGLNGSYTPGLYPILTANTVSGTFNTVLTGSPDTANAFGVYYKPSEVDLVIAPKSIGQVYNDLVVQNFDAAISLNDMVLDHTSSAVCKDCQGFSVWGHGYNGSSGLSDGNGASAFSNHTVGLIGGLDYRYLSGLSFHAVIGDSEGHVRLHDQSASGHNTQIYMSAAAHIPAGAVVFDTSTFFLDAATDVSRKDSLGNSLTSTVKDTVYGASVQIGVPLLHGDLLPFGKVTYSFLSGGGAKEAGVSPMILAVKHGHQTTGRYQLGVRYGHTYALDDDFQIRPQIMLGGEGNDRAIGKTNLMSMSSGALFFATSAAPDRIAAVGQVGVDVSASNLTFQLGTSGRKSGNQDQFLFNFGAAYHF